MDPETTIDTGDYFKLIGTYVILHVIRFGLIVVWWPLLRVIGYGLDFKQVILCAYAGLRGAVGMTLALLVAASDKIDRHIQDIILLHTLGVALLTLLINASTTGPLVKFLGLSKQSDIKKNILVGITYQLDKNVEKNINILKENRHFSNVDWDLLKDDVNLKEIKKKFRDFKNLHIDGHLDETFLGQNKFGVMDGINEKIKQHVVDNEKSLQKFKNLNDKTSASETFKGLKKSMKHNFAEPKFNINKRNLDDPEQVSSVFTSEDENGFKPKGINGRVSIEELITELRHKYLTILKSLYWEFFEEGQCSPEAVVLLIESADRALDHENTPMKDWGFLKTYLVSDTFVNLLGFLSSIPLFGKMFKSSLFNHFSLSYDICVNFIEAHEEASKMLIKVIENQNFVKTILEESTIQVQESEAYMH